MSATITDTDGTVLALDEAAVDALWRHHGMKPTPFAEDDAEDDGSWGWTLGRAGHVPQTATVIALLIDVYKTLVREECPTAYCRMSLFGPSRFWITDDRRVWGSGPTELQAWHAARLTTRKGA